MAEEARKAVQGKNFQWPPPDYSAGTTGGGSSAGPAKKVDVVWILLPC